MPVFTFTDAQLNGWIAAFLYPLVRILGLVATAPPFSNAAMPRRIRLMLGLALALGIAPVVPELPAIAPASGIGLWMLLREMLIGIGMGVSMRIVFAAIDMGSTIASFQMGLGFATFYDPQNSSQTGVISNFLTLLATLLFLLMNGHLAYVSILAQSFSVIPIDPTPLAASSWHYLALMGGRIFYIGLLLSLPLVVVLIIANTALGILNRVAPQLNLMAIGFPITLSMGFIGLMLILHYLPVPLERLFNDGLKAMLSFAMLP
ncbi:MAG: flagellar biosynthetic protein FliR [Zoogloeaceae bacterium]|jgi:flagellar biosynthetic protein FliR|nr:flagellar biosynthetic protein FliR [Zoogloeaceae bacterium]